MISALIGTPDDDDLVLLGHDVPAALAAARRTAGVAILLRPTPAASVLAVARAGERMPRKSTLFVPKPRTGLLMRCYADEDVAASPGSGRGAALG